MDAAVLRAMQQWPNVPSVYGWLALDRRGNWLIKSRSGRFEPITNSTMSEFIGRNYACDDAGRWYFQNGPQCVFVSLDYTPWVYRLNDTATGLIAHSGAVPREYRALLSDETGALLLDTDLGVGVALDRDLAPLLAHLSGPKGEDPDHVIETVVQGRETACRLFGRALSLAPIRCNDVPKRFRFVQRPQPPAGQPDC
jgi:DUF2946 family protein